MAKIITKLLGMGVDLSTKKALKRAIRILGIRPENIDNLYIEIKNSMHEDNFRKTPKSKTIVFLPQCLRDCNKCKARIEEFGYRCVKCSNTCKARKIKEMSEGLGYRTFIVPGGSMVSRVIKELKPKAVLGVACKKELIMAFDEINVVTQGIELLKDGCVNTDVDIESVMKMLK